ncbi:hypothetical protein QYF61_002475 [Mycteria americana]|uniref:Uncharacterized protein n=1 Tax=Mycteria americana TaxID=33587 RepID=A0AAN7PE26_MYCAM|nr:hypothetical protein QYF61_002475 [Mycteria americana]
MQHPLWARLGFVVFGIHTDVQQRVLHRHHRGGGQQHKQHLPHSHPRGRSRRTGELGGYRAVQKRDSTGGVLPQAAVNKVPRGPGAPKDTPADHQQLAAPRTQVQPPASKAGKETPTTSTGDASPEAPLFNHLAPELRPESFRRASAFGYKKSREAAFNPKASCTSGIGAVAAQHFPSGHAWVADQGHRSSLCVLSERLIMSRCSRTDLSHSSHTVHPNGHPGVEVSHLWLSIPFACIYIASLVGNCKDLWVFVIGTDLSPRELVYCYLSMLAITSLGLSLSTMLTEECFLGQLQGNQFRSLFCPALLCSFLLLHGVPSASDHGLSSLCGHLLPAEILLHPHQCQDRQDWAGCPVQMPLRRAAVACCLIKQIGSISSFEQLPVPYPGSPDPVRPHGRLVRGSLVWQHACPLTHVFMPNIYLLVLPMPNPIIYSIKTKRIHRGVSSGSSCQGGASPSNQEFAFYDDLLVALKSSSEVR